MYWMCSTKKFNSVIPAAAYFSGTFTQVDLLKKIGIKTKPKFIYFQLKNAFGPWTLFDQTNHQTKM